MPDRRSRHKLRLPLVRRPDPVLTEDELEVIATLLASHIRWAKARMDEGPVSESIITVRYRAERAQEKVVEALGRTVPANNYDTFMVEDGADEVGTTPVCMRCQELPSRFCHRCTSELVEAAGGC